MRSRHRTDESRWHACASSRPLPILTRPTSRSFGCACTRGSRTGQRSWTDQDLPHILAMRRPLGVTRVIQSAVYATYFEAADLEGRDVDLVAAVADLPKSFLALATGAVTRRRSDVVVEFLLALQAANPNPDPGPTLRRGRADRRGSRRPPPSAAARRRRSADLSSREVASEPATRLPSTEPEPARTRLHASRRAWSADGELQAAVDYCARHSPPSPDIAGLLLFCARELEAADVAASRTTYLDDHGLRDVLAAGDVRQREDLVWLDEFRPTGEDARLAGVVREPRCTTLTSRDSTSTPR